MTSNNERSKRFQSKESLVYYGVQELLDSEGGLPRYNRDVVNKMRSGMFIKDETNFKILEFGAGTGSLAEIWRSSFGIVPVCVEIDPSLILFLRKRGFETHSSISSVNTLFDYVYTSNVLEHIEDEVSTLREIKTIMKKGAVIAIYVPALPFLFSDFDFRVGHFRRYSKVELTNRVQEAGFLVTSCTYNDSLGVFASLATKIMGYKNKLGLGTEKSMKLYDLLIYPLSKILDRIVFKNLIGKNLLLIATVED